MGSIVVRFVMPRVCQESLCMLKDGVSDGSSV